MILVVGQPEVVFLDKMNILRLIMLNIKYLGYRTTVINGYKRTERNI
jgi:hypothetical protein